MDLVHEMLPKGNELPTSTNEAKKLISPLSLDVVMIHACLNHCILYLEEYEGLDRCPVCNASQYKCNDDCEDKDDSTNAKKKKKSFDGVEEFEDSSSNATKKRRTSAMVIWYLPVISRLLHLFLNPRDAEMMSEIG